jgi:hypothetical protein
VHQLFGVQRALHQRFDLARASHGDGLRPSGVTVLRCNDLIWRQVKPGLCGCGANFDLRPHQHRQDEFGMGCFDGAEQRGRIDRMNDRCADRIEAPGHLYQAFIATSFQSQLNFRKEDALPRYFFGRRDDFGGAGNDLLAKLVGHVAIEDDTMLFLNFLRYSYRYRDRVARAHGPMEMQRLIDVNRSWAGQLRSKYRGDQCRAPHAMRHNLVKQVALGESFVHVGGVDVAGHDRKYFDIFVGQRPDEACCVPQLNLVKGAIFDPLHLNPSGPTDAQPTM